jgi:cardiolipin synthase
MFDDFFYLTIYGSFVLAEVLVGMHILLKKHEEQASALLWLFIIIIVPIAGIALYLIFGINRFGKMNARLAMFKRGINDILLINPQQQFTNLLNNSNNYYAGIKSLEYSKMFENILSDREIYDTACKEYCLLSGNQIELLEDGTAAYPAMLEAIYNAKVSIRMQSFIITNDPIGKEFFDALEKKADEGVNVKVIYDGFGSFWASFYHFFQRYCERKNKNLSIRSFDKFKLFSPWLIQQRNHRKLLVIDGKVAFVGGINIAAANKYIKNRPRRKHIHDLHCRICGPAVSQFHLKFFRDWLFACSGTKDFRDEILPLEFPELTKCGDANIGIVAGGPGQVPNATQKAYFIAAATARQSLWIMTPYFVPSRSYLESLCMAVARGVDVKIIVPENNNHKIAGWAAQSFYRQLLNGGVKIFMRQEEFCHAKAMLVDNTWAYMGSSNCDLRSFRVNYELDFTVDDTVFIQRLNKQFEKEMLKSRIVNLCEVDNKPTVVKLAENLSALLAPIL